MRTELELIQLIEKYLLKQMNDAEKSAFEKEIHADAALKATIEKQQLLMDGVKRNASKQQINTSAKKYFLKKKLFKWGLGGAGLATAGLVVLMATGNNPFASNDPYRLPELNENNEKIWADADKYLPAQVFSIDNTKDTLVQTKDGIMFAIPANCFLDKNGKPVHGNVDLNIKEALKPEDIIKAGLDTRSDGKLLESGGMFYVNPTKDGENLKIDPTKGIYTEVPAGKNKDGMQLYEGQRLPDGSINWKNPVKPEKFLTTVDIFSLDFYPKDYLSSLKRMKYNFKDKKFTDSLYYSFASYFAATVSADSVKIPPATKYDTMEFYNLVTHRQDTGIFITEEKQTDKSSAHPIGINPAKIKAIWSEEFQGTLLATKEFELRLKYIFKTCDDKYLDLYVKNLDKKLCTIDSVAASSESLSAGDFLKLAKRGDGRVKTSQTHLKKLQEHYDRVAKTETEAIKKTAEKFADEQFKLDMESSQKQIDQVVVEQTRLNENLWREFSVNLDEAFRQLGIKKNGTVPDNPFGVTITGSGWWNIDQEVMKSTMSRTTLDYTDPKSGKKAVIKYLPFSFDPGRSDFDRITVYLLPDSLYSFMRMKQEGKEFKENLNELMRYDLVAVGYKGDKQFYFESKNVQPGNLTARWAELSEDALNKNLSALRTPDLGQKVLKDVNFDRFMIKDKQRQQYNSQLRYLEDHIRPVVLPCWHGEDEISASNLPRSGTK